MNRRIVRAVERAKRLLRQRREIIACRRKEELGYPEPIDPKKIRLPQSEK